MPDGTTINNYFIPRVHRRNLDCVKEELESYIESITDELKAMVCTTPRDTQDEFGNVINWETESIRRVSELLEEYRNDYQKLAMVEYAIDNPDDIVDDYDNTNNGE